MEQPLVAWLIPVYNCEPYLAACIESVQAQTYTNWEMIVIDDASTDRSRAVAEEYAACDPRIRVIANDRNRFLTYCRNRAVLLTQAEFVAMLDADDMALPDRLERSVAFLRARPDAVVVGGSSIHVDPEGNEAFREVQVACDLEDVRELLHQEIYLPMLGACVVRRAAYHAAGGYDEAFMACEDVDFMLRLARLGPIGYLRAPAICYRGREGQNSFERRARNLAEFRAAYAKAQAMDEGRPFDLATELPKFLEAAQKRAAAAGVQLNSSYFIGKLYLASGHRRQALRSLLRAVRACPGSYEPYLGLLLTLLPKKMVQRLIRRREQQREVARALHQRVSPHLIIPGDGDG